MNQVFYGADKLAHYLFQYFELVAIGRVAQRGIQSKRSFKNTFVM